MHVQNYSPKTSASTRTGIVSVVFTPVTPACSDGSVLKEEQGQLAVGSLHLDT